MQNYIASTSEQKLSRTESAMRNGALAGKLKLAALWLVVGLPLVWGVIKALQDGANLPM